MDRTHPTKTSTTSSDSLLPGHGHSPNYGIGDDSGEEYLINRSKSRDNSNPQRWHMVALCALTACITSVFGGMSLSFSSIITDELANNTNQKWAIKNDTDILISLIGVST